MIDDAAPWKCELLRVCQEAMESFAAPDLFPGSGLDEETQQIFLVERAAFLTAFTVRKLSEAGKISVQFLGRSIPFMRHPIIDPNRAPDKFNMHGSLEFYTESGVKSRLSYADFANMLIHSSVFVTLAGEDDTGREIAEGFAVASDRSRNAYLSVFSISDLDHYVRDLAGDEIVERRAFRDGRGNLVEVGSSKTLTDAEFERFFSQSGRKKERQRILDFVLGHSDGC